MLCVWKGRLTPATTTVTIAPYNRTLSDQAAFPLPDGPHSRLVLRKHQPVTVASLVPANWEKEGTDEAWKGKRYVSPDGTSWIAIYRTPSDGGRASDHLKDVIFAPNETISYLRGARTWVVVSGLKGDRVFYRKAVLACAGAEWHHIAIEYPIEIKEKLDPWVSSVAEALDNAGSDCHED